MIPDGSWGTTLAWVLGWMYLAYFLLLNSIYLMLNFISLISIGRYMKLQEYHEVGGEFSSLMPPITVIVPAYNEERSIRESVESLLQLKYPSFEVLVVNDGSTDDTLRTMIDRFDMEQSTDIYPDRLPTEEVRSIYRSRQYDNLRMIDKGNGGKADALNAGVNLSSTPLVCCVDGDSVLERESLGILVRPFLYDDRTVAAGGTIRVANGCRVEGGFIEDAELPSSWLPMFQVVEYLRAFLFGRMGWEPFNAQMIISGAFGLFRREVLVEIGGYQTDNVAEDMEVVMRMHRKLREQGTDYWIRYVPNPVCWTEVPNDIGSLRAQRIRWQQGLGQAIFKNRSLLFRSGSGPAGWVGFPYQVFFEWFGALIECSGYVYVALGLFLGFVSPGIALAFLMVAVGLGMFVSVTALLIEAISFDLYDDYRELMILFVACVLENFGYRQLNAWWRLIGIVRLFRSGSAAWGDMKREGFSDPSP